LEEVGAMGVVGLYGIVGLGLAALVAVVDIRTGRGYALGIFSSVLLATTIIVVVSFTILDQVQLMPTSPRPYSLLTTWLLFGYFILAVYATAADLIGAAIVAGKAGAWWWIAGFFVAAAVPTLVVALPYPYRYLDANTGYIVQNIGFLGMLVAPEATVLAYSITRLRHPVAPASTRQPAHLS
jgi:hypothetical protein